MSRLNELRNRLTKLHRLRRNARLGTAWAAVAVAALWALAALFLVDWTLEMTRIQRVIALCAAGGAIYWAYRRFAAPLLRQGESLLDVALLVERQQHIDSDLVAALQFETTDARAWGSSQLEDAVIDYVADFSSGLDVFEGFNREQMVRRGMIAGVTALVLLAGAMIFPRHALTFFNRLFLSAEHYPTQTEITKVWINGQEVTLTPGEEGIVHCAYGLPLTIQVDADGKIPVSGLATLWTEGGLKTDLPLARENAAALAEPVTSSALEPSDSPSVSLVSHTKETASADKQEQRAAEAGPSSIKTTESDANRDSIEPDKNSTENNQGGEDAVPPRATFSGKLPRLVDSLQYQLFLGDAWTEPALVRVIPLPKVEFTLTPTPPKYARHAEAVQPGTSARQFAVVEGSRVDLEVTSDKPLAHGRVLIEDEPYKLEKIAGEHSDKLDHWRLVPEGTPLEEVLGPLAYQIEVEDEDGLKPSQVIQGFIRLRADRPPRIFGSIVTRNVSPRAKQPVTYNATDDFGVDAIRLLVQVQRKEGNDMNDTSAERVLDIRPPGKPEMRVEGVYTLDLSTFKLVKGDQVNVTLEAVDYRGENEGRTATSEPLTMMVTDDGGVLADLTELDQQLERQMNTIIKLEIGEKP